MATNAAVRPSAVPPVAPSNVVLTEVDTMVHTEKAYLTPDSVLNEIPVTFVSRLTELAKDKFAREIMAGHATDKDMNGFRVTVLNDLVKTAHKGMTDRRRDKEEKQSLTFYKELIARGVKPEEAIKLAKL